MKKRFITFLSGMVVGAVMFGGSVAYASGILANLSNSQVFVDGRGVQLTAYNINGNNYVMLRDIGKAVDFNVYWSAEDGSVRIESDKPYTGIAPVKAETSEPASQPEVTTPADDVDAMKQSAMGLSRDKITVCLYKGYIGKGRKEPDPLRAG